MAPDPFRVLAHAHAAGDEALTRLLLERLFPWSSIRIRPTLSPAGARRSIAVLRTQLGL